MDKLEVYLEVGQKRVFASAVDWPGWCRSGRNEQAALQALVSYAARYAQALGADHLGFNAPNEPAELVVVERLEGNATTDFGTPGLAPASDHRPLSEAEVQRCEQILKACWRTFDAIALEATGKELRKGPRGGGRELEGILQHVIAADAAYILRVGGEPSKNGSVSVNRQLEHTRQAILSALLQAARGELPTQGPRGGDRWTPRYFVRRVAWHVLDHAWEIQDRSI